MAPKKLSLVFYSPQFFPSVGGLQNVVHYWANELTRREWKIVVLTQSTADNPDNYTYRVVRNAGIKAEYRIMRQSDAVVMFNVSLKALPQWILSGKPLLISHHTAFRYEDRPIPWQQYIKRAVANVLAKGNVACSGFIAKNYKNCAVVHSPYDAGVFLNRNLPRKINSIVFAGRLVSDKGVDILLDAIAQVKEKVSNISLTIIGVGPDSDFLKQKARSLGLRNQVRFIGVLSPADVASELNNHCLMVVPSRLEPFGIVVLEGLASGCRMIVSNQGGLPEAAGGLAILVKKDDIPSLVSALEQEIFYPRDLDAALIEKHLLANTIDCTTTLFAEWVIKSFL